MNNNHFENILNKSISASDSVSSLDTSFDFTFEMCHSTYWQYRY